MNWENIGISIGALAIFLYNEWDKRKKLEKNTREIKGVVRSEVKKANGVPFSFIQNNPLPCWCKDVDGTMIWINEEYTKQWGIKPTEYEGKTDIDMWGETVGDQYRKNDLEVIISKTSIKTIEMVPKNPLDPSKDLEEWHIWKFPVLNEEGAIIAVGGIAKKVMHTP